MEWKNNIEETLSTNVPENYEQYFVPVIGKPLAEDLVRRASLRPGEKVLDVACGTGIIARLASEKVGITDAVAGIDIHTGMLEVARSFNTPGKQIEWFEGNAEALPFAEGMFDVAFCQISLQYVEDKVGALKEMRRVLIPEGRIYLNLPGRAGDIYNILEDAIARYIDAEAAAAVNQVFSLNDSAEISRLLSTAGFRDISVEDKYKTLQLPPPKDFFRQYIQATPLIELFADVSHDKKKALEEEVVKKWRDFTKGGGIIYDQHVVEASARK